MESPAPVGRSQSGDIFSRWDALVVSWSVEVGASGEIERRHQDAPVPAEVIGRRDAESVRYDPIRMRRTVTRAEARLAEAIHRAVAVALRGEELPLAFEDHSEVGRQLAPRLALAHAIDAEHHAHPPPARGSFEAQAKAAAVDAWSAFTRQLSSLQSDIEPHGAPDAGPQIRVTRPQTWTAQRDRRQTGLLQCRLRGNGVAGDSGARAEDREATGQACHSPLLPHRAQSSG